MDSSQASSATGHLSEVDKMSVTSANIEEVVKKKKQFLSKFRIRLSKKMPPDMPTTLMPDGSPAKSSQGKSRRWFHAKISVRFPSAKGRRRTSSTQLSSYAIGGGSTQQQLPEHIVNETAEVPELDCSKLGQLTRVGSGSQAIVYAAQYGGTKIAIKTLRVQLAKLQSELDAFEREVNLLARLAHPFINCVIGVGRLDGLPCALLEWCDSDASRVLRLNEADDKATRRAVMTSVPSLARLEMVSQLAKALCFLHSGQALPRCFVMHRDLKPENVGLVEHGKRVKLLDFGLAVCLANDELVENDDEAKCAAAADSAAYDLVYDLTSETGTLRYMSPEVAMGKKYGLKADCYSFAIVAWELLIVSKPFVGMNSKEFQFRVCGQGLRPNLPPTWHPDLRRLFDQAWRASPADRPTIHEISSVLDSIVATARQPGHRDPLGEDAHVAVCCC
mmetsp:Transcript_6693/g.20366  ORF Transcript_6693/g.20366 Transcript_6693/m.20366 type:complete len:447 (-) Transcript_6693:327-1667(-)